MKWIERAIRPAPGMAPRGQITMTAGDPAVSPAPRPSVQSRPPRAGLGSTLRAIGFVCAAALFLLLIDPTPARAQGGDRLPEGTITKIEFEGNATIGPDKIKPKLLSRVGQPLDQDKVEADLKTLSGTKWFSDVRYFYDETPPGSKKYTLTFRVREMPLLTRVEFKGRKGIRQKEIEDTTALKVGNRADPTRTRLAVGQIQRLYSEKGYDLASVTLLEGGNTGDTQVVIEIFEGPKVQVGSIGFVGNQYATDARLKTMIGTRKPILGLFGKYHREMLDEDRQKLIEYYQKQGFFEVKITPETRLNNAGKVELTFVIAEGSQYKVRNLIIEGNSKIKTEVLREGMVLYGGKPFLDSVRDADKNKLLAKYYELGCIEAEVVIEPKFTDQHGVVDLVYKIEEKDPFLLGELEIRGNTRTKDKVIRREAVQAGLLPGEVLDKNRIDMYRRRLTSLQYFVNDPSQNKQLKIDIVRKRTKDKPYGDLMMPLLGDVQQARMQDPGPGLDLSPAPAQPPRQAPGTTAEPSPFAPNNAFSPPADTLPPVEVPPADSSPFLPPGAPGRGPAVGNAPPVGAGEPPASFPSIPGMNMTDVSPDRNDPFPNRSFADIVTSVEEGPTGRFMIGVGANSFQGLMGTAQIYEKNFDLFNFPRSWNELFNSQAFRGGGQEFRVSLQVGTLINMMQVSLREPYLFDLPIGAGATGYISQRIYPNWDERRGGGRFSLGRQVGTSMYADVAVRAEEVDFYGYRSPAPANYLAASGFTSLFSIRPSLRWDNRNTPFMATKGQYVEISAEQGFGSFTWSKFDAEGRMYIPVTARPDGSGKQYFTLRSKFGVATESTPVYERYFAGNFGSLRGFQYRTVSPHAFDVPTGGVMMAVGSVEYQFPWNARDTFNQIFFTDFGTVTGNYELSAPRVSVGTGLKVMIPAFGPIPFEFDLAFPVLKQPGDRVQFFNFTVGGFY
jgi:outer membrane protein insertion porin family